MREPLFTVVTPVYRPSAEHLLDCVHSVQRQTEESWEHLLIDDASKDKGVSTILASASRRDARVRTFARADNAGIVAATNDGIDRARGSLIAFLDQDDVLAPDALARVRAEWNRSPAASLFYSDEDKIDPQGRLVDAFRKPDFAPERLRGNMYMGHLMVVSRRALKAVGGLRTGFDGSQDHDLALRVSERGGAVVHIPEVLYHWRMHELSTALRAGAKPAAVANGVRAVQDHCDRTGVDATVTPSSYPGFYQLRRRPRRELVSIVIPTRGSQGVAFGRERTFVVDAVRSIERYQYRVAHEYVVVVDSNTGRTCGDYLDELEASSSAPVKVLTYSGKFNFSRKVNIGAMAASGDLLCFLNDDIEVISPGWLDDLSAIAQQHDVGAVGALLRYEDGTIQHGGHLYGGGEATHAYLGSGSRTGMFGDLVIDHEVSGVTAACLVQRREVWREVGGFTETLPANFNDVDFSLKILSAGHRIVMAPGVEMFHFESRTRDRRVHPFEVRRLHTRWRHQLERDRYMSHLRFRVG